MNFRFLLQEKTQEVEIGKYKFGEDKTSLRVGCLQTGRSVVRYGLARQIVGYQIIRSSTVQKHEGQISNF
jgi:hypothetical protein